MRGRDPAACVGGIQKGFGNPAVKRGGDPAVKTGGIRLGRWEGSGCADGRDPAVQMGGMLSNPMCATGDHTHIYSGSVASLNRRGDLSGKTRPGISWLVIKPGQASAG